MNNLFTNVNVFPNPSNGAFNLRVEIAEMQNVEIEVYNYSGKLIDTKSLGEVTKVQELISLNRFPNGFYWLVIRLGNGAFYSNKLVKVKG